MKNSGSIVKITPLQLTQQGRGGEAQEHSVFRHLAAFAYQWLVVLSFGESYSPQVDCFLLKQLLSTVPVLTSGLHTAISLSVLNSGL